MHYEQALQVIYAAIDVVNRQLPDGRRLPKSADTIIVGAGGRLDSLGLINLVLAIEERASDVAGAPVQLLDEGAMIDENGPFRDVKSLARRLERWPNPSPKL